jgi:putative ABC transport system permease protein
LFAVALVVGAPLGYVLGKSFIEMTAPYHMPVTFTSVIIAVVIMIFVLFFTVSTQIRKVLKANPVDGLKTE